LMSHDIVSLPVNMPLREAAQLLINNQISGAPVVNAQGRCVGVLSAFDFLRLAKRRSGAQSSAPPLPITCSFQTTHRTTDGRDVLLCTLAGGACPAQSRQVGPDCEAMLVCSEPHSVLADWQVVELETLPADAVRQFMTPDPVTVAADTSIRALARMMID